MSVFSMLKITLTNLVKRPATRRYPFETREPFAKTRGQLEIEIDKCIFCGICQKKCPSTAITVSRTEKTWQVDRLKCIVCNSCVEACPKKCLEMKTRYFTPLAAKEKTTSVYLRRGPAPAPTAAPAVQSGAVPTTPAAPQS